MSKADLRDFTIQQMGPNRWALKTCLFATVPFLDFAEPIGFAVGDLFGAACPGLETWDCKSATRFAGTIRCSTGAHSRVANRLTKLTQ